MNFSYYSVFFHRKIKNRNFLKYKSTIQILINKIPKKIRFDDGPDVWCKIKSFHTKILEKKLSYLLLKLKIDMAFFDFIKNYDMINK